MTQPGNRRAIAAALAFCLLLAAAGQYLFAKQRPAFGDGVVLYAASAILFILLNLWADRAAPAPASGESAPSASMPLWKRPIRIGLIALSLALLLWAIRVILRQPITYWTAFYLWIAAIVLFALAFVHRPSWAGWAALREKVWANRWEIAAVVVMLIAGALLRGVNVDGVPANIGGDEGSQGHGIGDSIMDGIRGRGRQAGGAERHRWQSTPRRSSTRRHFPCAAGVRPGSSPPQR